MRIIFFSLLFTLFSVITNAQVEAPKERLQNILVQLMNDEKTQMEVYDFEHNPLTSEEVKLHTKLFLAPKQLKNKGVFYVELIESDQADVSLNIRGIRLDKNAQLNLKKVTEVQEIKISANMKVSEIKDTLYSVFEDIGFNIFMGFGLSAMNDF